MSRPTRTTKTIYLNPGLPEDLALRIRLHLHSEVEGRIPHGAITAFFTQLVREYLKNVIPLHTAAPSASCPDCSGTGEGRSCGAKCLRCKGCGEVFFLD